jgi:hypothetical protein
MDIRINVTMEEITVVMGATVTKPGKGMTRNKA